ncbi:MAG: hypothetical protein WBA51_03180 [Erythrobacter sp.]
MIVHPAIAALRGSPHPQRCAAQANAEAIAQVKSEWMSQAGVQAVQADLRRYARGAALEDCEDLAALIRDHARAKRFVDAICTRIIAALTAQPLCEVPFRYTVSRGLSTLQLLQEGTAKLTVSAYEPVADIQAPDSAMFADRKTVEMVVSGSAQGAFHCVDDDGHLTSKSTLWRAGDCVEARPLNEARQIVSVEKPLVMLQLVREPQSPAPLHEVSLKDGRVLRVASGDKSASRAVMALGVLGALGDRRSLDAMAQTVCNLAEDAQVRWEAVRQTLGLDARHGLAILDELSARPADPLSAEAERLKQTLLSTQRELRQIIKEPA